MSLYSPCLKHNILYCDVKSLEGTIKSIVKSIIKEPDYKKYKKVNFYISKTYITDDIYADLNGTVLYGPIGCAVIDKFIDQYAVLFAPWINEFYHTNLDVTEEYLKYMVKHELKHTDYKSNDFFPFRPHDYYTIDYGYDPPINIPLFKEQINEIFDSPELKEIFGSATKLLDGECYPYY